jgi:AraC family transcriptional regulator of adaptative response/methylated-DNA-[protein]-cysteine methyltransferase
LDFALGYFGDVMRHTNKQNVAGITGSTAARYWRATMSRDHRADGTFVLGVRTTNIYCRPSCPARRPLRQNVIFFKTREEARQQGYRPCLRCKPDEVAGSIALVAKATRLLESASDQDVVRFGALAKSLGTTTATLRRAFMQVTGLRPRELAETLRLAKFKKLLRGGSKITDALYETGYGSSSRVYERSNAQLGYSIAKSKLGEVLVAATERGVSAVYLGDSEPKLVQELRDEYPRAEISAADHSFEKWVSEIVQRVEGKPPRVELPLDVQATAFQRRVWQELQRIPSGTTKTYSEVAQAIGDPKAVRAVARACATNPVSIVVPCHRVVRQDGNLAGYRWGISRKERLLEQERRAAI